MTKRKNYPRLRNGKLEGGGGLFFPHIFDEENKVLWIRITSSITAMGMTRFREMYPNYECKIPTKEYWEELKEKYGYNKK